MGKCLLRHHQKQLLLTWKMSPLKVYLKEIISRVYYFRGCKFWHFSGGLIFADRKILIIYRGSSFVVAKYVFIFFVEKEEFQNYLVGIDQSIILDVLFFIPQKYNTITVILTPVVLRPVIQILLKYETTLTSDVTKISCRLIRTDRRTTQVSWRQIFADSPKSVKSIKINPRENQSPAEDIFSGRAQPTKVTVPWLRCI